MRPTLTPADEVQFDGVAGFLEEYDRNLRSEGLQAVSERPLQLRQVLHLRLLLPSTDEPLELDAEVVAVDGDLVAFHLLSTPDSKRRMAQEAMMHVTSAAGPDPWVSTAQIPTPPSGTARVTPAAPEQASPPMRPAAQPGPPSRITAELSRLADSTPTGGSRPLSGRITRPFAFEDLVEALREAPPFLQDPKSTSMVRVVRTLFGQQATGTLHVHDGFRTKIVYVVGGEPVFARSDPPREAEQVGSLLVDLGRLTVRQREEALERARQAGCRVGAVFVEMGVIRSDQLEALLRFQVEVRTLDLFSWPHATFEFNPGRDPSGGTEAHPVRVPALLIRASQHFLKERSLAELTDALAPDLHRFVRLPRGGRGIEPYVQDPKHATTMVQWLDGSRKLRDVLIASPLGRIVTSRMLVLLKVAQAVEFGATGSFKAVETDARDGASAKDTRETTFRQLERPNYFDRLGVHFTSHPKEIEAACHKMLCEVGTGKDPQAQRARGLLDETRRALGDSSARKKYRDQAIGRERVELAADLLLRQAQLLAMRGEAVRVRELLDVADEMKPSRESAVLRAKIDRPTTR